LRYGCDSRRHALHDLDEVAGRVVRCEGGREPALNPPCAQSALPRCRPLLRRKSDRPAKEFAPAKKLYQPRLGPTVAAVARMTACQPIDSFPLRPSSVGFGRIRP